MSASGKVVKLAPGIHWVGVEDWDKRSFDGVMGLPYGTSYNAYLVSGNSKVALVDTVHKPFSDELLHKVQQLVDPLKIDYVVMNHAEPDHGGSISRVLSQAPNARLLANEKGVEMASIFYHVPSDRCSVVKESDAIDLGGRTLKFVSAPWLHWPETMFTFVPEERVLFTCDFFGAHIASDRLFADEIGNIVIPEAKLYYAVIMMPYGRMSATGLDKAAALNPAIIAPSHGPVWRQPEAILDSYQKWTRGPLTAKAIVAYATMWGSTKRLAEAAASALSYEGIETIPYELSLSDLGKLAKDMVDSSAIVVGSPTVLGTLHPVAGNALTMVRMVRPRARIGAFVGSYGWGGGAAIQARTTLESSKIEVVDSLDIKGTPTDKDIERAAALGRNVANKIRDSLSSA